MKRHDEGGGGGAGGGGGRGGGGSGDVVTLTSQLRSDIHALANESSSGNVCRSSMDNGYWKCTEK